MSSAYERTKSLSNNNLAKLRAALDPIVPKEAVALTCGSYARREATSGSDLDFFVLLPDHAGSVPEWFPTAQAAINDIVSKPPAVGGAFDAVTRTGALLENFGGDEDVNKTITRRMLYLLEGEYLTNEIEFKKIRQQIIERYVAETARDHQIAQYLLNDIIRYWRTVTVDYSAKTRDSGKPWAIRNIKLVFSRKIMYASGLFSVAMTADRTAERKIEKLEQLFSLPALDRIVEICGEGRTRCLRQSYDLFLDQLDDVNIRTHLETLPKASRDSDAVYRDLKNEGHRFTRELMLVFEGTFHSTHPIRRAVLF